QLLADGRWIAARELLDEPRSRPHSVQKTRPRILEHRSFGCPFQLPRADCRGLAIRGIHDARVWRARSRLLYVLRTAGRQLPRRASRPVWQRNNCVEVHAERQSAGGKTRTNPLAARIERRLSHRENSRRLPAAAL